MASTDVAYVADFIAQNIYLKPEEKQKLLEERRWEAFEQTYNAFARDQVCQFSQRKWDAITLDGEEITNTGLYDVYRSRFGG